MRLARKLYEERRREYLRTLQIYAELVMYGKLPEEPSEKLDALLSWGMEETRWYYESVVCDLHLADMRFVRVGHNNNRIEGFGKCPVGACT